MQYVKGSQISRSQGERHNSKHLSTSHTSESVVSTASSLEEASSMKDFFEKDPDEVSNSFIRDDRKQDSGPTTKQKGGYFQKRKTEVVPFEFQN